MAYLQESWLPVARTLGYDTEEAMLRDLYIVQRFSIKKLSEVLGFSTGNVRRRLLLNHFPLAKRGGKNRLGKGLLGFLKDEELRENPDKLAAKYGVHVSTVFSERKKRGIKKEKI